ncbi:hypothetical protein, partial [Streptosporangium roseum]|uniref:hypothetical protein n=1 Tax=Streptosporangium roseum TaxID=2001 RepID=UPI001E560B56
MHTRRERGRADDVPEEFAQFAQALTRARAKAPLTRARAKARDILVAAAFADAVGGIEIRRTIRPDGTEDVRTTPPNGRLALEPLARMHPDWRPVKAVDLSGPRRRRGHRPQHRGGRAPRRPHQGDQGPTRAVAS